MEKPFGTDGLSERNQDAVVIYTLVHHFTLQKLAERARLELLVTCSMLSVVGSDCKAMILLQVGGGGRHLIVSIEMSILVGGR